MQKIMEMLAELKADQARMEAKIDAYHEKRMAMFDAYEKRMTACLGHTEANKEKTKTEQDIEMMQSMEEHQDVPSEDVIVMPGKGLRKQRRVLNPAAHSRQKEKSGSRRNCGSRRKSDVACRKVSRHATVARRKRNLIRLIWNEVNCGPRSTLAAAGRGMIRYAGVAWLKGGIIRKDCTRAEDERATQRLGPLRKNLWTTHKGKCEINYMGGKRPLDVRKKRATAIGVGGWSSGQLSPMGIKVPAYKTLQKTFRLQIVKRAKEVSSGLRRIRMWTLWRGRPPPKRKKKLRTE
jgi:hypothetical protein